MKIGKSEMTLTHLRTAAPFAGHDGLVNASDEHWSSLRLWRALKVASTSHRQTLANGNQIADLGTYIKSDGTAGKLGSVNGELADVNLANNPFFSQFTDRIPLIDAAKDIADMQSAGMVRSLREAASLDSALVADVQALDGSTREQMMNQLDVLISRWAGTSTLKTSTQSAIDKGFKLVYLVPGMSVADYWKTRHLDRNPGNLSQRETARLLDLKTQQETLATRIGVLERFNGQILVTVGNNAITTGQETRFKPFPPKRREGRSRYGLYAFVSLNSAQTPLLTQSFNLLKQSIYDSLAMQTRLKPYLEDIGLSLDDSGYRLDFSDLNEAPNTQRLINQVYTTNTISSIRMTSNDRSWKVAA